MGFFVIVVVIIFFGCMYYNQLALLLLFFAYLEAGRILVPWQGIEPPSPEHWKCGLLTTGLPGAFYYFSDAQTVPELASGSPLGVRGCACAKSLQWYLTLCDPMDCIAHQAPLSMGFSREEYWSGLLGAPPGNLSQTRDRTHVSWVYCIVGGFFTAEPPGKPPFGTHHY